MKYSTDVSAIVLSLALTININYLSLAHHESIGAVEKLSKEEVEKVNKILFEGKQLVVNKEFEKAIETFSKGIKIDKYNGELLFYRAVGYLDFNQPVNTIQDLEALINIKPDYKKLGYLILSIANKRLDDNNGALRVLTEGLEYFPKFSEIYLARGHIYLFFKQYKNALSDFKMFIKYDDKKYAGYIGEGDALKKLGSINESIISYTKGINGDAKEKAQFHYNTAIEKRAMTHFQNKNYEKSKQDFELLLKEM